MDLSKLKKAIVYINSIDDEINQLDDVIQNWNAVVRAYWLQVKLQQIQQVDGVVNCSVDQVIDWLMWICEGIDENKLSKEFSVLFQDKESL